MKLRQFLSVLGVVALVAVIYSPSTLDFSASPAGDGGTAPYDTTSSGTSLFVSYLHQAGYHVTVANTTSQVSAALQGHKKLVYILVGADRPITRQELTAFRLGYDSGNFSALIAEGNSTNLDLLSTFSANVSGRAIVDPLSTYQDKRVFNVDLTLGGNSTTGVIDIASPIELKPDSILSPVANSSSLSYEERSASIGPKTVVAAGALRSGSRVVLLSDSAPFTNFLFNYTDGALSERAFVASMLRYVDPGRATPILFDASQYNAPPPPKFEAGIPIGPVVAYIVEGYFSSLNSYYNGFPSQVSGYLGSLGLSVSDGVASAIVALIILASVYGATTRWFAPEKKGTDDQPVPPVERTIVAESAARTSFLQTSRSKEGYVSALSQLYEVLDAIVYREFGAGLSSVSEGELASKVGMDEAARAKKLFLSLSKVHGYATGETRFLFPPVLRWRALTAKNTGEAESFLRTLGITIAEEGRTSLRQVQRQARN